MYKHAPCQAFCRIGEVLILYILTGLIAEQITEMPLHTILTLSVVEQYLLTLSVTQMTQVLRFPSISFSEMGLAM